MLLHISIACAFLLPSSILSYECVIECLSVHLLVYIWIVSIWELLWIKLLWTFMSNFFCERVFTSIGQMSRSGITGCMLNRCLTSCEVAKSFSKVIVPVSFPQAIYESSSCMISCQNLVLSVFFILTILLDIYCYLIVVLICTSLITKDVGWASWSFTYFLWRICTNIVVHF